MNKRKNLRAKKERRWEREEGRWGGGCRSWGEKEREETKEVTNVTSDQKNSHLNNNGIQCKGYTYVDIICIRLKTLFAVLYIGNKSTKHIWERYTLA